MILSSIRIFKNIIYIPPFIIASFCFLWHLAYTHLGYVPSIPEPNDSYQTEHEICNIDCQILKHLSCGEWTDYQRPKLCEFVCDSYLDRDILDSSPTFEVIFSCVQDASSREDVEDCKLSCSLMNEL